MLEPPPKKPNKLWTLDMGKWKKVLSIDYDTQKSEQG